MRDSFSEKKQICLPDMYGPADETCNDSDFISLAKWYADVVGNLLAGANPAGYGSLDLNLVRNIFEIYRKQ